MLPRYLSFLEKPAEQEFLLELTPIRSRDTEGHAVSLHLTQLSGIQCTCCDTIQVGESLTEAVRRTLHDQFGLTLVQYGLPTTNQKEIKNIKGIPLTRFSVAAYVEYQRVLLGSDGINVQWKRRIDALSWLENASSVPSLGNKDVPRQEYIKRLQKLYHEGAIDLQFDEIKKMYDSLGEDYEIENPDLLYITLPIDNEKWKHLMSVIKEMFDDEYNRIDSDTDRESITLVI